MGHTLGRELREVVLQKMEGGSHARLIRPGQAAMQGRAGAVVISALESQATTDPESAFRLTPKSGKLHGSIEEDIEPGGRATGQ